MRGQLLTHARHLLRDRDDAEDVVQEVMLKLWTIRGDLDSYRSVPALAVQITKNLCLNQLKAGRRQYEELQEATLTDAASPEALLEQQDEVAHTMRIIGGLPGLQQTILRMKHVEGFEIEEIAAITGSTHEAIRMNLSRARKRVKDVFFKMEKR